MEIKLCDSKTAYQVTPGSQMKIDLVASRNKLDSLGAVLAITPYVTVIKTGDGVEFSLYSSGKILFRNFLDLERTRAIAERIYSLLS
jgi:hypothetical protein